MNLDKSKKRIAKRVKMGFQGYPTITLAYHGPNTELADQVSVQFVLDDGAEAQFERFTSKEDVRHDDVIQSSLVKIIERSGAKTVTLVEGIAVIEKD